MNLVIDASVAIKWYLEEIHYEEADLALNKSYQLHAPEIIVPEFGSIVWKKQRSRQTTGQEAMKIIAAFTAQNIILHSQKNLLKHAFEGAVKTGQTVYDWMYLSLAFSLSCKLITADQKFYEAIKKTSFKNYIHWIKEAATLENYN